MGSPSKLPRPVPFKVEFESCPVDATLGVLGRKWALLIIRDIALFRAHRYSEMLRATPGIRKRILSLRLKELEVEGYLVRTRVGPKNTRWDLTQKGRDVLPVLMILAQFGAKWHADRVFSDKRPRSLDEIFERRYVRRVLGRMSPQHGSAPTSRPNLGVADLSRRVPAAAYAQRSPMPVASRPSPNPDAR